ncbi:MAG: DUF1292 domain-containing protein [Acutalibacteraceae bacterium]|nr:DUF1292 domain-containing protein [Acutalibacteraceae bacterium]HCA55708.1 DUF1292 domain-containing protein [Oscillospiraceae bacterium]
MKDFAEPNIPGEDDDELDNIITLNDEDGNEVDFEFLDLIEYEGNDYVVLLPVEEDSDEVVILQVEEVGEDEESYISIDDEEVMTAVFEIFKEKYKDDFNFVD